MRLSFLIIFRIEKFVLDGNFFQDFSVKEYSPCESIAYFSLSANPISNESELLSLMRILKESFSNIKHLVMKNTPIAQSLGEKFVRNFVIYHLQKLSSFNHSSVIFPEK